MRKSSISLVAVICFAGGLQGQDAARWESLDVLRAGQKIQVVATDRKTWEGAYVRHTPEGISVRVDKGFFRNQEATVARASVVRVSRVSHGRNTLIGLVVGAAAGGAVTAALAPRIDKGYGGALSKGGLAAILITTGGGGGALIGYGWARHETLYRQAPSNTSPSPAKAP